MRTPRLCQTLLGITALALFPWLPGCGGPVRKYETELRIYGFAYIAYNDSMRKGPSKVEELGPYMENRQDILDLVRKGDIVLIMGAKIPADFPEGTTNTLLAYLKEVPERGGSVLLGDGSIRVVTKDEFAKLPRPRKSGS